MKLTKKQSKLVEKNIGVAYWFCGKRKIPYGFTIDELVSEYLETVCIAATKWIPGDGRTFQNFAIHAMSFRWSELVRRSRTKKRGGDVLLQSLDKEWEDGTLSEHENLGIFQIDHIEKMEEHNAVADALKTLDRQERAVFKAKMKGLTFKEMEKQLSRRKERLRQVYSEVEQKVRRFVLRRFA
jgi:RNA polymerase sigma factor (sigma-70 family)